MISSVAPPIRNSWTRTSVLRRRARKKSSAISLASTSLGSKWWCHATFKYFCRVVAALVKNCHLYAEPAVMSSTLAPRRRSASTHSSATISNPMNAAGKEWTVACKLCEGKNQINDAHIWSKGHIKAMSEVMGSKTSLRRKLDDWARKHNQEKVDQRLIDELYESNSTWRNRS